MPGRLPQTHDWGFIVPLERVSKVLQSAEILQIRLSALAQMMLRKQSYKKGPQLGFLRKAFGFFQPQLRQTPKLQRRNQLGTVMYNTGLAVLPISLATSPTTAAETREWGLWRGLFTILIRGSVQTLPSQQQLQTFSPSPAAQNGSAQHKTSASFLKLLIFSGTIFWGLWFYSKVEFKEENLGSLHHDSSNV